MIIVVSCNITSGYNDAAATELNDVDDVDDWLLHIRPTLCLFINIHGTQLDTCCISQHALLSTSIYFQFSYTFYK